MGGWRPSPPAPLADLIGGGRALVQEAVLTRLGLSVGDSLRMGDADLRIAGVITSEPDRAVGFFSLGPRVLVADSDLRRHRPACARAAACATARS